MLTNNKRPPAEVFEQSSYHRDVFAASKFHDPETDRTSFGYWGLRKSFMHIVDSEDPAYLNQDYLLFHRLNRNAMRSGSSTVLLAQFDILHMHLIEENRYVFDQMPDSLRQIAGLAIHSVQEVSQAGEVAWSHDFETPLRAHILAPVPVSEVLARGQSGIPAILPHLEALHATQENFDLAA